MRSALLLSSPLLAALALSPSVVLAEEPGVYHLSIKDHRFVPDSVEIPADSKVTLIVKNEDATAEEFDSIPLRREKVVAPGKEITILLGPLKPGSYKFIGEYHEDTAQGSVVVK